MASKLPDDKRAAIIADIQVGGMSCRAIGRKHGVSHAKVSQIARDEGLGFERAPQTASATAAAAADHRATRASLIRQSYEHAQHFLNRARAPFTTTVTTQHGIDWVTYAEPSPADQRNLMTSFGIAVDKALVMEKHDTGTGVEGVVSLLETLRDGLVSKHGTGDDEHPAYNPSPADV